MRESASAVSAVDPAFRAIFDESLDAMTLADDEGRFVEANPAACRLLGVDRAEILQMSVHDLGDAASLREAWRAFLAAGSARGDLPLARAGTPSRIAHFAARANVVPGKHLAILRDVTAERRARDGIDRSRTLFASAFEVSPIAMFLVSAADRTIAEVNAAATTLLGRPRTELVEHLKRGGTFWVEPVDRARMEAAYLGAGRLRDFPTRARRADGEVRDVLVALEPIDLDGTPCLLAIVEDVTEHNATKRILEATEHLAHVGDWTLDVRTRHATWSHETSRILGCGPADFAGMLALIHIEDRARVVAALQRAMATGTEFDARMRIVRSDGGMRWVHSRAITERDADGQPARLVGTLHDITEHHAVHEALQRSQEMFATAFHAVPTGITIVGPTGSIVDANDAAVTLAGRRHEELVGRPFATAMRWHHAADRDHLDAELAARGEVRSRVVQLDGVDGDVRDVSLSIHRIAIEGDACMLVVAHDITDQRTLERELEEVQSQGRIGSWVRDHVNHRVAWSRETYRIFGVDESVTPTFEGMLEQLDENDRGRLQAAHQRAAETGGGYTIEYRITRRDDGRRRWILVRGRVILDRAGRQLRTLGTVQDITEAREASAALAISEERHRLIVETSSQGVVTTTPDGTITFVNRRLADMLGRAPEAVIGRTVDELVEHDPVDVQRLVQRRAAGLADTYDLALIRPDGSRVVVEVTASPFADAHGVRLGTLAMVTDVTERRQSEELRARLAAIVASSRDAITSCALDGTLQTWNAAAERMFDYSADEAIGRNHLMLVPMRERDHYEEVCVRVARGEVVTFDAKRKRRDGTTIDLSVTRAPVFDTAGNVVAVSTTARDITAQKALEASLREAEAQLRQMQKMEAVSALAGGIAHDFNNILSVVLGCAELIEESVAPNEPVADFARDIREAATHAGTLTRQLLAFSRRQVLAPSIVNLSRVLEGMEAMLRRVLGPRATLVNALSATANVRVDASQFEQVIMNLVINARDAMPDGGEVAIHCDPHVVSEAQAYDGLRVAGDYVRIVVSDTGTGMDETTRARMFEPFFTTKEKGKGTGLGLATVFGIVKQSGGFIDVASELGRGTRITIDLPAAPGTELRRTTGSVPVLPTSRGETILVVDDEQQVGRLVQQQLRRQGYRVLVAANAGEAMLLAEQNVGIDLLVTDVLMPIMNGPQLAERLQKSYPDLRILFMSGYHDDDALRGMLGRPTVGYLQKPAEGTQLLRKVRDLLDAAPSVVLRHSEPRAGGGASDFA